MRIEFDSLRRQGAAVDVDAGYRGNLRKPLGYDGIGRVVDLSLSENVRSHRNDNHRNRGSVEFAIRGIASQGSRQISMRRGNRRLHVARRAVDVPIDAEGQLDAGRADTA